MQWDLRLAAAVRGETLTIGVGGRLSAATAPLLATRFAEAIGAGTRRIMLDLKELDYISSAGLMTIEAAAARLQAEGGWLRMSGAQPAVRVALELGGLDL